MKTDVHSENRNSPIVILGRPRSGTRLVAEYLRVLGVDIGSKHSASLDSQRWALNFVVPLIGTRSFPYSPSAPVEEEIELFAIACADEILKCDQHFETSNKRWGFKVPEALYVMPVISKIFPRVRFIHVIRDGRDVAVSLNGYFQITEQNYGRPYNWNPRSIPSSIRRDITDTRAFSFSEFCKAVTFGDSQISIWNGLSLNNPEHLCSNRFLLQLQSWMQCVEHARRYGSLYSNSNYFEIRYEELCLNTRSELSRLDEFLDIIPLSHMHRSFEDSISFASIGNWRRYSYTSSERRDFEHALAHARLSLKEFGYE